MNAEYLFKKLGYKKRGKKEQLFIEYLKEDTNGDTLAITFELVSNSFMCAIYKKDKMESRGMAVFLPELEAITMQCKELGWI